MYPVSSYVNSMKNEGEKCDEDRAGGTILSTHMIPEEIREILSEVELEMLEEYVIDLASKMLQQETNPWGYSLCFNVNQLGTRIFVTDKDIEPEDNLVIIRED
jgi:hypothetical protein